jgi:hypothetical protein
MTQNEIIEMARQAGLAHFYDSEGHCTGITDANLVTAEKERNDERIVEMLMPFAKLVAAKAIEELERQEPVACRYCHYSATLGAVYFDQNCVGCVNRMSHPTQRTEQEPFEDLATELFVVAQVSPADNGFSETIDRIESWLRGHFTHPPQTNVGIEERAMQAYEEAKKRNWVGLSDESIGIGNENEVLPFQVVLGANEVLRVTPDGQVIWHPDADRMIEESDFNFSPAMPHILRALRKREWVGLTANEQSFIYDQVKQIVNSKPFWVRFADAIEAKLKEKNT